MGLTDYLGKKRRLIIVKVEKLIIDPEKKVQQS